MCEGVCDTELGIRVHRSLNLKACLSGAHVGRREAGMKGHGSVGEVKVGVERGFALVGGYVVFLLIWARHSVRLG